MTVEPALIISLFALALNAIIAVFVVIGFFWRFATKKDFERLENKVQNLETRMGNVDTGLGQVETRLGQLETGVGQLEARVGQVETRVGQVETKVGQVETGVGQLETRFERLEGMIIMVNNKADASLELHHSVRGDLKVLTASVERIEGFFETPKLKSS